jgi:predicted RNase H-like nuclease
VGKIGAAVVHLLASMMDDRGRRAVLGVDAAWTCTEPSGVALAMEEEAGWRLAAVEASYGHFVERANGGEPGEKKPVEQGPPVAALLEAARKICGRVDLIAVDMPLSRRPIAKRRFCDDEVSRKYGAMGAGTHSPSAIRPGQISDLLRETFETLGYALCAKPPAHGLIEVYPHPALIAFLGESRRLPYKAGKIRAYWPDLTSEERRLKLHSVWTRIVDALEQRILGVGKALPPLEANTVGWRLKAYEDKLDAVVCAAVAIACLDGEAIAYGDEDAAIWVPAAGG